jgi:heat shock protein HslJ
MNTKIFSKTILTLLIASTLFTACAPFAGQKKTISLEALYSGTWHLIAYGNKKSTQIVTPGLKTFINFQEDGNLNGNAGCNNFFGPFEATEKGNLSLKEAVGSTLMYCEDFMDEEATFLAAIQSAKSFHFNDHDQLVIKFKKSVEGFDYMLFVNQQATLLLGTDWVLSSLIAKNSDIPVPPASAPILNLDENGRMTGHGGCNNIFSDFTAADGSISFGPIASTRMFCEGLMELENSFTTALDAVTRYEIVDDQLVLSTEDFSTVLTFSSSVFALEDTHWYLQILNGEDLPSKIKVSLTLSPENNKKEGAIFGSAGCNGYTGTYTLDEDRIKINLLGITAMFCEDAMDIEAAFIAALQDELTYEIQSDRLTLLSDNNRLIFLGEAPSLAGDWRLNSLGTPDNAVEIAFEDEILAKFEIWEGSLIGSINGKTSCSEYTARFYTNQNAIAFGEPEIDLLDACAEGSELDTKFFATLSKTTHFGFSMGSLLLFDAEGTQLVEFVPQFN